MKKLLPILLIGICSNTFASEIDYSHCQEKASGPYPSFFQNDHPFTIESDGKITPHASVNSYEFDKKTNSEILKIVHDNYGIKSETHIQIKRDDNGQVSQIVHKNEYKAPSTRTGMGSNLPVTQPMGGFGIGGFYGGGITSMTTITDVRIENGKCFPYRSYMDSEIGSNLHRSLLEEAQLCRDITSRLKDEQKKNSKLAELKSCHDSYQNEAQKVINAHKERNADLYAVAEDAPNMFGGGIGGYGMGMGMGYGGFAMSIDNIVNSAQFSPAEKLKMLTVYCMKPDSPLESMANDEILFEPGSFKPTAPGQSNGGFGTSR